MKLSIIIPAYGVEKYIKECLNSILANNQKDYEVIVVNDCSKDQTLAIALEIAASNPAIKVITPPENLGLPGARNYGLMHASGEYIAFLDGDDFVSSKYINSLYLAFNENANAEIIRINYTYLRTNSRNLVNKLITTTPNLSGQEYYKQEFTTYRENVQNMSWQYIAKRSYLNNYQITFDPNPRLFEDIAFLPRLLYHANEVVIINQPLIFYRENPNSIMNSKHKLSNNAKALFLVSKQLRKLASEYPLITAELRKYANFVMFFAFKHGFRARDFKLLKTIQTYHEKLLPTYQKSEQLFKINFKNMYFIAFLASLREGFRHYYLKIFK